MPDDTPARRTQEMRSAETRAKILDATLECLIELGYSGTSTPEVCRRAGMSRGALLHHFPTKAELVTSAISHLAERRGEELRTGAVGPRASGDPIDDGFERMWAAFFSGPLFHAALELWVAARCDRELHEALYPVEQALGKRMSQIFGPPPAATANDAAARERFDTVVGLSIHLLRGMALQRVLKEDDGRRRALYERWKAMARRELGA